MEGLQVTFLSLHVLPWDGRPDYDVSLPPHTLSYDILEDLFPFLAEVGVFTLNTLVARILDTLTVENYDNLSQELLGSSFPNMSTVGQDPEALRDTVNMFFSAAVNEKIDTILCARLCGDICRHWAQSTEAGTHQSHHHNQHHQYHHHQQPPPNQYPPSAHHGHRHSHHHGQPHPHHQHHQGAHLPQHPQHIVHHHQHHHHGHHQQPFHPPHQQGPPQHHYNHNAAPFYVPGQYGRLCKDICHHWAQVATETGSAPSTPTLPPEVTQTFCARFRSQLLNQCQEEFERGIELQKELELLPPAEKEIQEGKLRNRTLANMKFVGELYKRNLITERIMHQLMFILLFPEGKPVTDEGLEMFCELMGIVGKQLDRPKAVQYMQQYRIKLTKLSATYTTPRVRVKLQSLLDLWKNNWVREPTGEKGVRQPN